MIIALLIALIILAVGLVVEIGIASWNIRRAGRYQRQKDVADSQAVSMKERAERTSAKFSSLDKYATDISWLLMFLYNRYDKFADIDKEICVEVKEDEKAHFLDLQRAHKLIRVTARANEKIEKFMGSIATQIQSITEDLEADEEAEEPKPEDPPTAEISENSQGEAQGK
jgi:hypothetical protein